MGYLVLALAYLLGGALLGAGVYLVMGGSFPGWWKERMLWPLVRATPTATHLQGWAVAGLGASVLAMAFSTIVPQLVGGLLVLLAIVAYLAAAAVVGYTTWLSSRRPAAGPR